MTPGSSQNLENSRYLSSIALPDVSFVRPQQNQSESVIENLTEALNRSFAQPIDYPPIPDSLFEGDTVAIALQTKMPHADRIALALAAQFPNNDFTFVCDERIARQLESIPELNGRVVVHDPTDQDSLSMTGIDANSEPVYVNRTLFDADVVIPVGFPSGANEDDTDCIYPFFSSQAEQLKLESQSAKMQAAQIRLANNQLGCFWGVQLVIGPGDEFHDILTGEWGAIIHQSKLNNLETWKVQTGSDAEFALATIETESDQQSWNDFCAAVVSADQVVAAGAPILVCAELNSAPPRKIKKALTQQFESRATGKLDETLRKVADIVSERAVFLNAGLNQSATEELGLGFVSNDEELQRIIDRHPNGVLLRDAHRCHIEITN